MVCAEIAKRAKGDLDGAWADMSKVIELNPKSRGGYNGRAWLELLKGDFDTATIDATRAIHIDSKNGSFYGTRGWARYGNQDVAGAVEDLKKALELFGTTSLKTEASTDADQGLLDFINGDYPKAINLWQKAIQSNAQTKRDLQPWIEKAIQN